MSNTFKAICLRLTGSSSEFDMKKTNISETISTKCIPNSFKRSRGIGELTKQTQFVVENKILSIYSWEDGEAGWENKHELPPPIDKKLYFGNIFIVGSIDEEQVDINIEDYNKLTNKYFKGFEDLGSQDSWSDEESIDSNDSIHNFIVDDVEDSGDEDYSD
tara:strand:- start:14921 stop:15403 length:483 start_codon:yes stop_codon:yes gene_type:complete